MLEIPWTESRDAEAVQDTLRQAAQTLHQRSCRQGSIDVLPGHGTLLVSGPKSAQDQQLVCGPVYLRSPTQCFWSMPPKPGDTPS